MISQIESLLKSANSADEPITSVNSARRQFADAAQSRDFFDHVCQTLLDINEWRENSSPSSYTLFDESGTDVSGRPIQVSDFIRIKIYGAGKYDWVRVISIDKTDDEMVVTVRPTFDPTAETRATESISHFFHADARNNFCVQLDHKVVNFYVIGLNERQNVAATGGVIESARNASVANLSYYLGIQKAVWIEFCKNFLRLDDEKAAADD